MSIGSWDKERASYIDLKTVKDKSRFSFRNFVKSVVGLTNVSATRSKQQMKKVLMVLLVITLFFIVQHNVSGRHSKPVNNVSYGQRPADTSGMVYGEIPWMAYRGVVMDNSSQNFAPLRDGNLADNTGLEQSALVDNPDIVFPFPPEMKTTITEIWFGDGQHSHDAAKPMKTRFLAAGTYADVPGPTFEGNLYNEYEKKVLPAPVRTDYFIMPRSYPLPTEIKFFGWYKPVVETAYTPQKTLVENALGAVSYVWNFQFPSGNGMNPAKMEIAQAPNLYRLYVDMGNIKEASSKKFIFQPMNGAWKTDDMLDSLKRRGKDIIFCLKGDEGLPDFVDACRQIAIRYGSNANVPDNLVNVYSSGNYPANVVKKGLGLITKIQLGNEPNRWWKGRFSANNPEGMMTPFEIAAQAKLCYDAIKQIDPNIEVILPGLATNNPAYLEGMILWAKMYNKGNLPWDAAAYHEYNNTQSGQNQTGGITPGVAPELAGMLKRAKVFAQVMYESAPARNLKTYITETGYSISPVNPSQAAPLSIAGRDRFHVQADWSIRSALVALRAGLAGVTFYQLYDDDNYRTKPDTYMNWDLSCGIANEDNSGHLSLRPATRYFQQLTSLLQSYSIQNSFTTSDSVYVDKLTKPGMPDVYSLVRGSASGKTSAYTLNLPGVTSIELNSFNDTGLTTTKQIISINGSYTTTVTETPVFIKENFKR